MSSTASASAYWRVAGMSYLKYSNLCATLVRDALKEPLKASAKARELVYFKNVTYKDGKPDTQGAHGMIFALCAAQVRAGCPLDDVRNGIVGVSARAALQAHGLFAERACRFFIWALYFKSACLRHVHHSGDGVTHRGAACITSRGNRPAAGLVCALPVRAMTSRAWP
jgi:F-type H+-transporting ATPase subunit epsilon